MKVRKKTGRWWAATASAVLWWLTAIEGGADGVQATEGSGAGQSVVDMAIEAHGGDIYSRSRTEMRLCSGSGCYEIRAHVDGGLFDLEASGRVRDRQRRVRITNETTQLWLDGTETDIEADRVQAMRDWVMARIYFSFLPYRLNDESVVKTDLGSESWNGRELHKVKVTFRPASSSGADDEFLYWFDPSSGRLVQFAYSYSGDPGGLRFRKAFNYRRIGGILFYDQENWGIEGDGLSVDRITPESVGAWKRISTVELDRIVVETVPLNR